MAFIRARSLEQCCCAALLFFPLALCTALFTWAECVLLLIILPNRPRSLVSLIGAGMASVLYFLCIYSYFQIVRLGPGSPLDFPELRIESIDQLIHGDGIDPPVHLLQGLAMSENKAFYPYCVKCLAWKPARAHHCSRLNKCVLKMDHYCPWFSGCVGFRNHKMFVQFLAYVTLFSGLMGWLAVSELVWFFKNQEYTNTMLLINVVMLAIVGMAFCISVGAFFGLLAWLVSKNLTTIEFQDRQDTAQQLREGAYQYSFVGRSQRKHHNIYDLGRIKNWQSVMGKSVWTWLLPIVIASNSVRAEGNNGIQFETNPIIVLEQQHDAALQQQLNQQLAGHQNRMRHQREGLV